MRLPKSYKVSCGCEYRDFLGFREILNECKKHKAERDKRLKNFMEKEKNKR